MSSQEDSRKLVFCYEYLMLLVVGLLNIFAFLRVDYAYSMHLTAVFSR